ncbi:DsbE family thiol:disulfide interchange protein [Thermopetrobacter sp. TC1]|uniref:DsbE family thiol:disulfide interchange protein n=1 Tax=Thermopetrobacter sp. TC1 TaxID=1495045 RepID=UPI00056F4ACF|nr:DsbE family thiol:disulfide interchange protein [Thermopetrobacter sp. TC1]
MSEDRQQDEIRADNPAEKAETAGDDEQQRPRIRLVVLLPLIAFAVISAFFVWGLIKGNPRYIPSVLIGKPVPEFNLPPLAGARTLDGKPVPGLSSADLKAIPGIKLVSFFASWCVSCRQEHPFLMELARKKVIPIVGIAYKDAPEKSLAWLEELGNPYSRIGVDRKGRTGIDFGVYGIPESFFVDERGIIVYKYTGPLSPTAWEKEVVPALEKARRQAENGKGS